MGTYLVMKNNFRRTFHHKILFAVTFLIPVILCLIIGMVRFGKTTIRVGILGAGFDVAKSDIQEDLYPLLNQSEGLKYELADAATKNTDLMTGKFHVILDYRGSDNINYFQLLSYQNKEKSSLMKNIFQEAFTNQKPVSLTGMKKQEITVTERSLAILLSMFMVFSSIYASGMIGDRQSGTIQRYHLAHKNDMGYVLGYLLHNFLITFVQVMLCMAVLMLVQKGFSMGYREGFVLSVMIAVISTVFSILICLVSKSEVQANITASALAAVMSLLGGTFVAVESMPGLLRILSLISPIRWILFFAG